MFRLRWLLGSLLFKNMIKNGSFEEGEKYWNFYSPGSVVTSEDKYSGIYSAKVVGIMSDYYPDLVPGQDYYFRVRVKPVDPNKPSPFYILFIPDIMFLRRLNGGWELVVTEVGDYGEIIHVKNLERGWTEILVKFRLSSSSVNFAKKQTLFYIHAYGAEGCAYYLDDFYLSTVPPPRFPLVSLLLGV